MVEPGAPVGRGDAVEGGGEGSFERVGGTRLDSAQDALELGPAGFDGRKIGRVTRQVKELEPGFGQGGLDRLGLVRGQIVHQHGGAGWRRRRSGISTACKKAIKIRVVVAALMLMATTMPSPHSAPRMVSRRQPPGAEPCARSPRGARA